MLPHEPWLRRQPKTDKLFWADECEQVGEEEPWAAERKHGDVLCRKTMSGH